MASENAVLMSQARQSLQGKWGLAIGTFIVYFLIDLFLKNFLIYLFTVKKNFTLFSHTQTHIHIQ